MASRLSLVAALCLMCLASTCHATLVAPGGSLTACDSATPCPPDQICSLGICRCPFGTVYDTANSVCVCGTDGPCNIPGGQVCLINGVCGCAPGTTECAADTCTNTAIDNNNCGSCGNACTAPFTCTVGTCRCPTGFKELNGACLCGWTAPNLVACRDDQVCVFNRCACPAGQVEYQGACVCGINRVPCAPGQKCVFGICK